MEHLLTSEGLISLLTLAVLEIILGIDNIIFISIITAKIPAELQARARFLGIMFALVARIIFLFAITWIVRLVEPLFTISILEHINIDPHFSGKDLILFAGGLFLIAKSTAEIHDKLEGSEDGLDDNKTAKMARASLVKAVIQIVLIDIVFSFDSILTAVGLSRDVLIMIIAVVIALVVMLAFAKYISDFVEEHPTVKMLALSFLVMIGFLLIVEAFGQHVPKGYVYFAMSFALGVEMLNIKVRKQTIKQQLLDDEDDDTK